MNCKPGDVARVVSGRTQCVGMVVKCHSIAPGFGGISSGVSNSARPLVKSRVLNRRKLSGRGSQFVYTIGRRPVVVEL